jgi:drug/metabolite transporter (DMT)-like permease
MQPDAGVNGTENAKPERWNVERWNALKKKSCRLSRKTSEVSNATARFGWKRQCRHIIVRHMKAKDLLALIVLAALWGSSFLFVRVAAPALGPFLTIFLRVSVGAVVLMAFLRATHQSLSMRQHWRAYLGMGALNAALPFTLFAIALLNLNASYTSILNATSAFFTAIVAAVWIKDPLTWRKLLGIGLGMAGVVMLVEFNPVPLTTASALSVGLVLLATFSYGIAAVFARRHAQGIPSASFAAGQQVTASLLMLPFAAVTLPAVHTITLSVIGAVLGVGVLCTGVAYLLYYRLIANVGPVRALTVTFLVPVFGIFWGALLLGEAITPNMIAGFVAILIGMSLVLNLIPAHKSKPAMV